MARPIIRNYLHILFTTKGQENLIIPEHEESINEFISDIFKSYQCTILAMNIQENHIHILCDLSRNVGLAYLIREAKSRSSRHIQKLGREMSGFDWQDGYTVLSVSHSDVEELKEDINNQTDYHKTYSFEDEYMALLEKHDIRFNKLFLW